MYIIKNSSFTFPVVQNLGMSVSAYTSEHVVMLPF